MSIFSLRLQTCKIEAVSQVEFYCNKKSKLKLFVVLSLVSVSQLIVSNNWFSTRYTNSYKMIGGANFKQIKERLNEWNKT